MHESLVFITSDKQHDYHAVREFMSGSVSHLKGRIPDLNTVISFSDQYAAQYKRRGPFLDIANAEEEYGLYVQHHYFGSRHGKGPSDGETAVVKRMASSAIKSKKCIFACSAQKIKSVNIGDFLIVFIISALKRPFVPYMIQTLSKRK